MEGGVGRDGGSEILRSACESVCLCSALDLINQTRLCGLMLSASAASSSLPPRPACLEISAARKRMSVNNCAYYFSHLNNSPQSHCDTIILKLRDRGISVLYKPQGVQYNIGCLYNSQM